MAIRDPWHCGLFVSDVENSTLGQSLSRWNATEFAPGPTAYTDRGAQRFGLWRKVVRTQEAEPFFKITVEAIDPPSALAVTPGPRWHHVAYRSQAFAAEVAALEAIGYRREAWGQDSDGNIFLFAYMVSPEGLRIELNPDRKDAARPLIEQNAAEVARDIAAGVDADAARGRRISHISAVVEDPGRVATDLTTALGFEWNDPLPRTFEGVGADAVTRCIEISSRGSRRVRLLSALPAPLGAEAGWNHLALYSDDLARDKADLAGRGYRQMALSRDDADGAGSAIFRAPEGTYVMLVQD